MNDRHDEFMPPQGDDSGDRFAAAVQRYLSFRAAARTDVTAYLAAHAGLRDLLEPMLRAEPHAAQRTFGDYQLGHELGRGGMGVVHEAVHQRLGRRVALKLLPSSIAPMVAVARLQREARLAARLSHPGIVQVFDAGLHEGIPYYAMELIDGHTLIEGLAAWHAAGLPGAEVENARTLLFGIDDDAEPRAQCHIHVTLDAVIQVADALAHAHEQGIVHRDVKPANLLLRGDGRVFLSDFGIARSVSPGATLTAEWGGTPNYMAPEQAVGENTDHRADVFSLGAVLFEMLTLSRPFRGETALEVVERMRNAPTPDPRAANTKVSADLAAVVMKAMAIRPAERYGTMAAFVADLRACRDGRDVAARPPTRWLRLRRWARREPWRAVAAATAALALVIGSTGGVWFTRSLVLESQRTGAALAEVNRLSLGVRLEAATRTAEGFLGRGAEQLEPMRAWLATESEALRRELPVLRQQLELVRTRALPYSAADALTDRATHPRADDLDRLEREIALKASGARILEDTVRSSDAAALAARRDEIAIAVGQRRRWTFARPEDQFLHDETQRLVGRLATFVEAETGSMKLVAAEIAWGTNCERIHRERGADAWRAAIAAVRADPRFGGLLLSPDPELLPIGADPRSGLPEFMHLRSAAAGFVEVRREQGRLVVDDGLGIVFVLLPPGEATVGGFGSSQEHGHHVRFDAFLLGKYEVTQAQWQRLAGNNPSRLHAGIKVGFPVTDSHPVEGLSAQRAVEVLQRFALDLPTEAQWEYACRAGTTTQWYFADRAQAGNYANFADGDAAKVGVQFRCDSDLFDGAISHAAVGSYLPNAFGLHDMHGNVQEFCPGPSLVVGQPRDGDGRCGGLFSNRMFFVMRGGCCTFPIADCAAAVSRPMRFDSAAAMGGCRACRPLRR